MSVWDELARSGPDAVTVAGVELRAGSRVRLRPHGGADVFDLALAGRVGTVHSIEEDTEGKIHLTVTVDAAQPDRRFFFAPDEVEPVHAPRILLAGIGNVFLGDDGFGVELAGRLAAGELPAGVEVVDFGIRGMDLAYALLDGWDAAVLLDATPRGDPPGTLYVIEAEAGEDDEVVPEAHGMDPVKVLALARTLGGTPPRHDRGRMRAPDPHERRRGGDRRDAQPTGPGGARRGGRARRVAPGGPDEGRDRVKILAIISAVIAVLVLALVGTQLPEIRRYLKMKSM
jgi:hydrogenase maturation protease